MKIIIDRRNVQRFLIRIFIFASVLMCVSSPMLAFEANKVPFGYLLVQGVSTYYATKYGAISTREEAEKIFSEIEGKVSGVEYESLFYSENDIAVHKSIADIAHKHNVDLWASSFRLVDRIRAFGQIEPEFQAFVMRDDGSIVPAYRDGMPLFDTLNRDAVTWFLARYSATYLKPLNGRLNGFFFNEDTIAYLGKWSNNARYDYWNNAVYSKAVLKEWRSYCIKHKVKANGLIVDKFPVHIEEMVGKGLGMTAFYPGYDIPEKIHSGQRFIDLPRAKGVWNYWYDFLSEQFINNWIGRLARTVNEANHDNPQWHGVLYFGLHHWSLPYEVIKNPDFTVPRKHIWGAWGRQRGLDLEMLSKHPEIAIIACETYPPISANLEFYIQEFKRITEPAGKKFGLMLHRDDDWKIDPNEEKERWQLIKKYKPRIVVRFPLKTMLPWGKYFEIDTENYFMKKLMEYRLVNNENTAR